MSAIRFLGAGASALILALTAPFNNHRGETTAPEPAAARTYGPAQNVGNGTVRTYITVDPKNAQIPLEVGVALSESAMNNLPTTAAATATPDHAAHASVPMVMNMYLLDLPAQNPTPYKFVQFDWNPVGHEPPGVYDLPHFDFHFYRVPVDVRNAINPADTQFATKAALYPAEQLRAPFYIDAAKPAGAPAAAVTVPLMGLHWLDVRSPELQGMAGHPEAFKPFTKTYIYGSWNGEFIFDEPMITRAYLMSKKDASDPAVRDEIIAVSTPAKYALSGFYPNAYRITYDAAAKEYRVALTQLVRRD
jgi:hypothetical protein